MSIIRLNKYTCKTYPYISIIVYVKVYIHYVSTIYIFANMYISIFQQKSKYPTFHNTPFAKWTRNNFIKDVQTQILSSNEILIVLNSYVRCAMTMFLFLKMADYGIQSCFSAVKSLLKLRRYRWFLFNFLRCKFLAT